MDDSSVIIAFAVMGLLVLCVAIYRMRGGVTGFQDSPHPWGDSVLVGSTML